MIDLNVHFRHSLKEKTKQKVETYYHPEFTYEPFILRSILSTHKKILKFGVNFC